MPWAGGNYTKGNNGTGGWVGDASLGIGIEAGRHDTQDNDFATGINACLNKDGSNAATANLNLGAFRYTNAGAATARTDLAQVAQVQDGDYVWLGTTGGTATAQTASASPAISAYKAGQKFRMKIGAGLGSTTAAGALHTLNVNSLGTVAILDQEGANPTAGNWIAGAIMEVIFDGSTFIITNDPGGWQNWSPVLTLNSGTVSNATFPVAKYRKIGKIVTLILYARFDTNSGNSFLEVTGLPVNIQSPNPGYLTYHNACLVGGVASGGSTYNNAATNLGNLRDFNSSSWGTATDSRLGWTINYQGA